MCVPVHGGADAGGLQPSPCVTAMLLKGGRRGDGDSLALVCGCCRGIALGRHGGGRLCHTWDCLGYASRKSTIGNKGGGGAAVLWGGGVVSGGVRASGDNCRVYKPLLVWAGKVLETDCHAESGLVVEERHRRC